MPSWSDRGQAASALLHAIARVLVRPSRAALSPPIGRNDKQHKMTVFAQAFGEYGSLTSIAARGHEVAYAIGSWLSGLPPATWIVAAVIVLALVVLGRR
jgi:hypothetical protein